MKKKIIITLLLAGILSGCKSANNDAPPPTVSMSFAPRDANYVWVRSSVEEGKFKIVISSYNQKLQNGPDYAESWQRIDSPVTEIEADLKNIKKARWRMAYIPFEKQAEYVETEKHNPNILYFGPVLPRLTEYRTDEVASLRITADRPFLGVQPGELLNSRFKIFDAETFPCWFPVLSKVNGTYIGEEYGRKRSLDKITAQNMVVPACAIIDLIENKPLTDDELQATLTVDMTTKGGKHFRASQKIETSYRKIFPDGFHDDFMCSIADKFLAERID